MRPPNTAPPPPMIPQVNPNHPPPVMRPPILQLHRHLYNQQ